MAPKYEKTLGLFQLHLASQLWGLGEPYPPNPKSMRKKLPPVARTPLHNSSASKTIEYLLEASPNAGKIRHRLKLKEREAFFREIEAEFPIKLAALKSKKEVLAIVGRWRHDRSARKWVKRYFRKARDTVYGKYRFKTVYSRRCGYGLLGICHRGDRDGHRLRTRFSGNSKLAHQR